MNSNTGEEAERGRHVLQLFVLARVEKESCFPKSNSNGFAIKLGILVFFWKKVQKLLSNGLAISIDKFGNLTNGGSNCAYMQKSVRLGIGVLCDEETPPARVSFSRTPTPPVRRRRSFHAIAPWCRQLHCSVVSPSSIGVPVAGLVESPATWNSSVPCLLASLDVPP